jgi:hypothetical protein
MAATFNFENGTNGSTIQVEDHSLLHLVNLSGTATATYTNVNAIRGNISGNLTAASGANISFLSLYGDTYQGSVGQRVSVATVQVEFRFTTMTTGSEFLRFRSENGNTRIMAMLIGSNPGRFVLYNNINADIIYESSNVLSPGVDYRLDMWCHRTNAEAAIRVTRVSDDNVMFNSGIVSPAPGTFGGSGWDYYQIGKPTSVASAIDFVVDSISIEENTAAFLDPPSEEPEVDPTGFDVELVGTTAQLTWDAPAMVGATHVDIFHRNENDDSPFNPEVDTRLARVPVATTNWDHENLSAGHHAWQVFPVEVI